MASKEVLNGEVLVADSLTDGAHVEEHTKPLNGADHQHLDVDVLVIGTGFSGVTAIHRCRKAGLTVKAFESGEDLGGVWYWNRYPGARVDSETPFYQLDIPEVYNTWHFSQRFPDHRELRKYFAHVDNVLDLRKDITFNARVCNATWEKDPCRWTVKTLQGHTATAKYLLLCTGLLHRTYTPNFPGLEAYKGELYHSGAWNQDYSAIGKRAAIIGAGATAVQITQELGKQADELTVLLRRPSYCLPMCQRTWTVQDHTFWKSYYGTLLRTGRKSRVGFPLGDRNEKGVFDVGDAERQAHFEDHWTRGGFHFQVSAYADTVISKEANEIVYKFWRDKVRERLTDPKKQAIMAPDQAPFYFGTKRSPLEHDYYDVLNQPNVKIHDLKASPLKGFTETGLEFADGTKQDFDTVVLATGFDSYTGSLTQMGLKSKDGIDMKDVWAEGVHTYLGLTVSGFPNMFMSYTPQSPTALANGTTIIEAQVETVVDMIKKLESEGALSIEATEQAEKEWGRMISDLASKTLFPYTDSWWNGTNIPGKKKDGSAIYIGGIDSYEKLCRDAIPTWHGFKVRGRAEVPE